MISKQTLSSKLAIAALLILLLFLADLKYKQWQSQKEIEKQKLALLEQADSLQKKNDELNQSLQYLSSPDFKERVARQQLSLKKDGETVYSFGALPEASAPDANIQTEPNAKKWWDYFFSLQ